MSLAARRPQAASGCPAGPDLARFVDGQSSAGEHAALATHLPACARCRRAIDDLRATAALLGEDPAMGPLPDLAPLVMARAELPRRRRQVLRPLVYGLSLAAALCGGVLVDQRLALTGDGAFQARGGGDNPDRWVAIHPYLASPAASAPSGPLADGAKVGAEPLLFAYDNGGPTPYRHLMVLGIDAAGGRLWYFPEQAPGAVSVAIEAGAGRELRDEVCFEPARGPLRLLGIFSHQPLSIEQVGRAAAQARPGERLPLPDTGQHAITLTVDDAAAGARRCRDHGR